MISFHNNSTQIENIQNWLRLLLFTYDAILKVWNNMCDIQLFYMHKHKMCDICPSKLHTLPIIQFIYKG